MRPTTPRSPRARSGARGLLLLGLTVAFAVAAPPARASGPMFPRWTITVGPSIGLGVTGDQVGTMASLDVTGALAMFWASTGVRALRLEHDTYLFPYVEAGIWLWANLGVGYTVGAMGPKVVRHNLHLFLGLPIPVPLDRWGRARDLFVLEPYYRPQFGLSSSTGPHRFIHEVGLLFKWHIDLDQARRKRVR